MNDTTKRRLAGALWAVTVVAWLGDSLLLFLTADDAPIGGLGPALQSLEDFAFVLVGALGLVVLRRQPGNAVGWWIMVAGLSFPLEGFTAELTEWGHSMAGNAPWVVAVSWFPRWVWLLSQVNLPFTLLLFPNGRLPSRTWRPVLWLAVALLAVIWVLVAFDPQPLEEFGGLPNPLGVSALAPLRGRAMGIAFPLVQIALPLMGAGSLIGRYRRGNLVERLQIKVLLWVGAVTVAFFTFHAIVRALPDWAVALGNILFALFVGGAFTLAILRYRLYDIDRLISRTLAYTLVVAVVAGLYGLGAVWLPTRLVGQQTPLFVAGSTLVVAALFNPMRRRVMAWVDARFYRSRYDAERVANEFAVRLRAQVDPGALTDDWAEVVIDTLRPAAVGAWLRETRS